MLVSLPLLHLLHKSSYLSGVTVWLNPEKEQKNKILFIWAEHGRVHRKNNAKYLSSSFPSLSPHSAPIVSPLFLSTWTRKGHMQRYLETANMPTMVSNKPAWQLPVLLKPHLFHSVSTYSIGINITVYGNCFNPHLLACFDDLPHKKGQLSIFKIQIV